MGHALRVGSLVAFTLLCVCASWTHGSPIFVSPSADAGGNGSEADPFSSLAEALASSTSESIQIILFPGVYNGANNTEIVVENIQVEISSYAVFTNNTQTEEEPLWDCQDDPSAKTVFWAASRGSLTLHGVSVQSCRSAVAYKRTPSTTNSANYSVTIRSCRFYNMTGDALVLSSIKSLAIVDSSLEESAGLWARVIGVGSESHVTVSQSSSMRSGGFLLMNVVLEMEDVTLEEIVDRALFINPAPSVSSKLTRLIVNGASVDTSALDGVAVYAEGLSLENNVVLLAMEDCVFENLEGQRGIVWLGSMRTTMSGSVFTHNTAKEGGGLFLATASITLSNSTFSSDGAVYGGALFLQQESRLILESGCTFENTVASSSGSAIYCNDIEDETTIAEADMDEYLATLEGQIRCTVNGGFHGPDGDDGTPNGENPDDGGDVSWTFYLMIGVLTMTAIIFVALAVIAWKYRHALMEDGRPTKQETTEDLEDNDLENGEEELSVIDTLDDFNDTN